MTEEKTEKEFITLWEGEKVEVSRKDLLKDFDYLKDVQKAAKENDLELIPLLFVLIGGEETFNRVREHIVKEKGRFDVDELGKITKQLFDILPKGKASSSKRY